MRKIVGINARGFLVGESHHNAKLSDAQVDQIRDLREDKLLSYDRLARLFQAPRRTIRDICNYRRRAQHPHSYRTVRSHKNGGRN